MPIGSGVGQWPALVMPALAGRERGDKGHISSVFRRPSARAEASVSSPQADKQSIADLAVIRSALDSLEQGVCVVDRDLRLVLTNARFFDILELPPDLVEPGTHAEVVFRYNAERGEYGEGDVEDLVRERVELSKQFLPHRFERTRPDGTILEVVGAPLPGGGFISTFTDVTERHRAEDEVREAEERFRTLVEHAPDAVVLLDVTSGRFVEANQQAIELFGYSREELLTLGPSAISAERQADGRDSETAAADFVGRAVDGEAVAFEWLHRDRDGRVLPCEVRLVRLNLGGRPLVRGSIIDISERKRSESLTQRLGRILDASLNEIFVFDAETCRMLLVNEGARRNLGYDMDELRRMSAWDLKPEVPEPKFREMIAPLRSGTVDALAFETVHRRKDGSLYPVEVRLQLFKIEQPPVFVAIVLDISERRRAENELQESQRRLQDYVAASADWLWETDETLRFTYISDKAETVFGVPAERYLGKTIEELLTGAIDEDDLRRHMDQLAAREPFRDFTFSRAGLGGREFWLRTSGVPVFDADGRFCGYRGVASDATELKQAEGQSRRTERRFRDLAEGSIQGIFVHRSWRLLFANQSLAEILGYDSVDELMELGTLHHFFHPSDHARLRAYSDARARGEPVPSRYELQYRRRDGSRIWVEHMARVVEWDGEPAIQTSVIDIDERKTYELEIQEAKEKAEAASKAKSDFLALMSHELRTPLNAILGFSEVIKDSVFGPISNGRYLEYAQDIHDSGSHLLQIINDILDISKIEAGHEHLDEQMVELDELVDGCLRLISPRARDADVALEGPEEGCGLTIRADATKLKQVVINLLNNAVKFTPAGGQVTLACGIDADGDILLRVDDTGIGMRPEDIEIALLPFGQIESAGARKYQGTGLGLPLAKALAEIHGGSLTVSSEVEKGTTVEVRLPRERRQPQTPSGSSDRSGTADAAA